MQELIQSLLAIIAVGSAGVCYYYSNKINKKLDKTREQDRQIETLVEEISVLMAKVKNSKEAYEEAKRVFREAEEKDAKTK